MQVQSALKWSVTKQHANPTTAALLRSRILAEGSSQRLTNCLASRILRENWEEVEPSKGH